MRAALNATAGTPRWWGVQTLHSVWENVGCSGEAQKSHRLSLRSPSTPRSSPSVLGPDRAALALARPNPSLPPRPPFTYSRFRSSQPTEVADRPLVSPAALSLPVCSIARPGDRVCWYQNSLLVQGVLTGHKWNGRPIIANQFGDYSEVPSFDWLRLEDPGRALGPNWDRIAASAAFRRPTQQEHQAFDDLLAQRTPPGPRYLDLITEIWQRGFEVFVVGGTVRDVLGGRPGHDVDLATTMPLVRALPLVMSMYGEPRTLEYAAGVNGHFRPGKKARPGDPFIDLCVFKHALPSTPNAVFGSSFERDVAHRDFACNSIYYDPINDVLIDPSARGIPDAEAKLLHLVCDPRRLAPEDSCQLAIRFFKFLSRGFSPSPECDAAMRSYYFSHLTAMSTSTRIGYVRAQILGKCARDSRPAALTSFRAQFVAFGIEEVWTAHFEPHREEMLL